MVVGNGYGGLEHRTSTSLICSRDDLPRPLDRRQRRLPHAADALVPRVLPPVERQADQARTLHPFDLSQESPTTLLWAFEGITAYYEPLALVRCGIVGRESWLELMGRKLTDVMRRPGRHVQSCRRQLRCMDQVLPAR